MLLLKLLISIICLLLILQKKHLEKFTKDRVRNLDKPVLTLVLFGLIVLGHTQSSSYLIQALALAMIAAAFFTSEIIQRKPSWIKARGTKRIYNLKYSTVSVDDVKLQTGKVFYLNKVLLLVAVLLLIYTENSVFTLMSAVLSIGVSVAISYFVLINKSITPNMQPIEDLTASKALNEYQPAIVFYFSAVDKSFLYHIYMWYPFIKKTGIPFYILTRETNYLKELRKEIKDVPIVHISTLNDLGDFIPDSVKVALYANNGAKNTHLIRFNNLTHIQLLHGESEKPPSFNPMSKMYDYLFVCGQRAIDRYYENQVRIDPDAFVQVGRPQVDTISRNISLKGNESAITILIAPTWMGYHEDSQFSSLFHVSGFLEKLLSRKEGFRVIFRRHPLTDPKESQNKLHLDKIKTLLSLPKFKDSIFDSKRNIVEDFNESDLLVTDISSVPVDYLVSSKPILHINVNGLAEAFENDIRYKEYRKSVYMVSPNFTDFNPVIDDLLYSDSKKQERLKTTNYYHGDTQTLSSDRFVNAILDIKLKNASTLRTALQQREE